MANVTDIMNPINILINITEKIQKYFKYLNNRNTAIKKYINLLNKKAQQPINNRTTTDFLILIGDEPLFENQLSAIIGTVFEDDAHRCINELENLSKCFTVGRKKKFIKKYIDILRLYLKYFEYAKSPRGDENIQIISIEQEIKNTRNELEKLCKFKSMRSRQNEL